MPFHPSEKEAAQACRSDEILTVLGNIQEFLQEAHALCDEIHGGPQSFNEEQEAIKPIGGSRLNLVEERVSSIEFDTSELLPRLRDILNRLGQVK